MSSWTMFKTTRATVLVVAVFLSLHLVQAADVEINWQSSAAPYDPVQSSFGDVITLTWNGNSASVVEVTKAVYDACGQDDASSDDIAMGLVRKIADASDSGKATIVITDTSISAVRYFISDLPSQCASLRLRVNVANAAIFPSDVGSMVERREPAEVEDNAINSQGNNVYIQSQNDVVFQPWGVSVDSLTSAIDGALTDQHRAAALAIRNVRERVDAMKQELLETMMSTAKSIEQRIDDKDDDLSTAVQQQTDHITKQLGGTNSSISALVADLLQADEETSSEVQALRQRIDSVEASLDRPTTCKDLFDIHELGHLLLSDFYTIYPDGETPVTVFCEMSKHDYNIEHDNGVNIARGKTATQSSTASGGIPGRAVDGNTNNNYQTGQSCTHTDAQPRPWWRVDLGTEYIVQRIRITNRGDCCGERLTRAKIIISRTIDETNTQYDEECTPGVLYEFQEGQTRDILCNNLQPARYVTVRLEITSGILTLCEVQVFGTSAVEQAKGWTVIASQPSDRLSPSLESFYEKPPPSPTRAGVVEYFFKHDLKKLAKEIYVRNSRGQEFIFDTSEFTGPLVFDGPNFIDAYDQPWRGVIAGNDSPVVNHFQIGNACDKKDCHVEADRNAGYTAGNVLVVFDWHQSEDNTDMDDHAHFGGSSQIENGWSHRGTILMIR